MPISPQDYSLWSRMTGNRYPRTAKEKAAVGPDVKKFVQNMDKQGAQGGKSEEKTGKVNITGKQIATGALGVGLVAGAVAAARRQGTRDAVTTFLRNLGDKPRTKTYTRPNQGDITPPPVQQQSSAGMQPLSEAAYSALQQKTSDADREYLGSDVKQRARSGDIEAQKVLRQPEPKIPDTYSRTERMQNLLKNVNRDNLSGFQQRRFDYIKGELDAMSASEPTMDERSDPSIMFEAAEESSKRPAFANFKPADNTKPAPGTILGRDLSPAEKEKALARAKLQEFNAERYGVDKSGVRAARYEIEKQKSQTNQPVIASQPSAENDEFYTRDELNTMGKIDKLVASIKTGARPQQPKAVATDVKNTALLQSADNKTPKVNKIIGEPTLKSKHDTKMAVHEETRVANTINEYKGEFDSTYGKVLNQITQGNVSGASDRDKRRAERLANKVLNKNNPGLVNRFHAAVKQDADIRTRLSAEDASFAADKIFDEERTQDYSQAQTTGKGIQTATTGKDDGGAPLSRDMKQMRSVKNLETGTKTAIGREIKGRARLMDVNVTETPTRKDLVEGETADVPGAIVGPSTVDLSQRATGQNLQYTGKRPAGEPGPVGTRGVRKVVNPPSQEDSRAGEAGTGIYGRELGKFVSGAMSKEGEYSKGAAKKPTDVPFKNVGMTPREQRGMGGLTNEQVIANIRTDRSGKLTKSGRAAREEMISRNPQGIPLARGGGIIGRGAPSDPGDKKTLGADFTQKANQALQDITRLPVDEQPAARQKLLNELKSERNLRSKISDVMD